MASALSQTHLYIFLYLLGLVLHVNNFSNVSSSLQDRDFFCRVSLTLNEVPHHCSLSPLSSKSPHIKYSFVYNSESLFIFMIKEVAQVGKLLIHKHEDLAPSSEVLSKCQAWWPTLQALVIPGFGRKRPEHPWGLWASPSRQLMASRPRRRPFPGKLDGIP